MFASFDGRGIASDVADQAVLLSLPNQGLMHELRQFHLGELGESTRKGGLMRKLLGVVPATDAQQLLVAVQAIEQVACGGEVVNRLGNQSTGDRIAILRRATVPALGYGEEAAQRDQG